MTTYRCKIVFCWLDNNVRFWDEMEVIVHAPFDRQYVREESEKGYVREKSVDEALQTLVNEENLQWVFCARIENLDQLDSGSEIDEDPNHHALPDDERDDTAWVTGLL